MTSTQKPTRVALVTGAAQGIGKAIALRLAKDGLHVALNDIPPQRETLLSVVEEIRAIGKEKSFNSESSIHLADVSNEEEVKKMIEEVVEKYGGLDVMVANAGITLPPTSILDITTEEWDKTFAINVRGTFLCYKYAGAQMIKQGRGGRIVGASSMVGKMGNHVDASAYIGTKFAIRGITQATATEFGKHKITVNAYAPGTVDTVLLREFAARQEKKNNMNPGDFLKSMNASVPLGYCAVPEDIAGLVSYLVSDEAHFITGQSVSVNGGAFCD